MAAKYILNIKTGIIHDALKPCNKCNQAKEENKQYFDNYADAENFFEGKTAKGKPCGICLKNRDE